MYIFFCGKFKQVLNSSYSLMVDFSCFFGELVIFLSLLFLRQLLIFSWTITCMKFKKSSKMGRC
jgi:hypothetical protein